MAMYVLHPVLLKKTQELDPQWDQLSEPRLILHIQYLMNCFYNDSDQNPFYEPKLNLNL